VFMLPIGKEKIHNHYKNIMAPFWHPKVKSACGNWALYQGKLHIYSEGFT
jgi:hypothetical protein